MINHPTLDWYAIRAMYHNKVQKAEIEQVAKKNLFPSHRSVLTCSVVEESEPIAVMEIGECSTGTMQREDLIDILMKSRAFKNLFESLEFEEQARKEATKAIFGNFRTIWRKMLRNKQGCWKNSLAKFGNFDFF